MMRAVTKRRKEVVLGQATTGEREPEEASIRASGLDRRMDWRGGDDQPSSRLSVWITPKDGGSGLRGGSP